jgi:hypothetical protein
LRERGRIGGEDFLSAGRFPPLLRFCGAAFLCCTKRKEKMKIAAKSLDKPQNMWYTCMAKKRGCLASTVPPQSVFG